MRTQPGKSRGETLDYLQAMLGQLRIMAKAEQHDMLAYLIEMAYLEASAALAAGAIYGSGDNSDTAPPE